MRVGVGLPTTTPGADGAMLVEWARRADAGPFSSLGVLDRLLYDCFDPFTALAAAAAVTERIRLATMIAIGPLRPAAVLVKNAASVQALSRGRLTLGLAVGAREDDYEAAGVPHKGRGARLSDQLAELRDWRDSPAVPTAVRDEPPELLVGGLTAPAFARMARYGDGYAHNGGPPRAFASAATKARAAWSDLGRPGRPALWGQAYFALGDEDAGEAYLLDYYAFTGPFAAKIAAGLLTSPRAIRDFVRAYQEEGCDELVMLPTVADIGQIDRLADVLAT
jgi:alkanesulfonate monooxygenase SsuD/methylene tetrahydromethanopterin reductase-like flavin-dependent oxidoreductase (luciferase family)